MSEYFQEIAKEAHERNKSIPSPYEHENVEQYNFAPLLSRLQQASPEQRATIARQITDVDSQRHTVIEEAQLDELVAESSMVAGRFNSLVEGLNRQIGLMSLVINGGKR